MRTSSAPSRVENREVSTVGTRIFKGLALFKATRTPIIEVGISCKEVAFKTKNIADEYSAFSVLSRSFALSMPKGVPAPEIPSRLTDKFILIAPSARSSSVLNSRLERGRKSLEIPRVTPLSFHTCISPSHTAYVATSERQSAPLLDAPSRSVGKKVCGEIISKINVAERKITEKMTFIRYYMLGRDKK